MDKLRIVFLSCLLALSLNSEAFCDAKFVNYNQISPQDALIDLNNMSWIPDGPENSKYVYIIAAPWCPICKMLYEQTRGLNTKVQFRWIMSGGRDSNSKLINEVLSFTRDPELLKKYYTTGVIAGNKNDVSWIIAESNMVSVGSIKPGLRYSGFPAIIFFNGQNLTVFNGVPAQLSTALDNVAEVPSGAGSFFISMQEIISGAAVTQAKEKAYIPNGDQTLIYAFPSELSLRLVVLSKDFGVNSSKIITLKDNSSWIYIKLFSNGLGGWARLGDFH